jgi:hypothetical protein
VDQQRAADPLTAERRAHEEILEPEPAPTEEGRVVVAEEREAGRRAVNLGNHHLGGGDRAEERRPQPLLGGDDRVGQPFILGQPADQVEDQRHIGGGRGAKRSWSHAGF